jgi:GPH family glycoside/pentoside/hexuronide:cation symporter
MEAGRAQSASTSVNVAKVSPCDISPSPKSEKLPLSTKLFLALGEMAQGIYTTIAGFYLNSYFLEVCCLDPASVSFIQLSQGLFDAFNDPFIGHKSDKCRTRWGRRRPFLLFGAPFYAVFYCGLWSALPPDLSEGVKIAYYMVCYMGVSIGVTMIQVQITSLAPELTTDYDERTVVSAYRLVAVIAGGLVCVLGHAGILSIFDDVALGYRVSGCVFAAVILIVVWTVFFGIKERFIEGQEGDDTFNRWQELKTMFENKAFLNVIIIYICGPTAVFLVQTNLLLYCKYAIGDESLLNFIMIAVQGTAFLSAPFWVWIGQRFGKRSIYFFGGPILITAFASLYVANDAVLVGMLGICVGSCLAVAYLAPYSMLPDVLELDELRTGKRREGLYGGFFTISMKISTTIAITMTNVALKLAGYKSPQTTCNVDAIDTGLPDSQPDSVVAMIRALISLFPAFLILLAMFFSWRFPITKGNHSQTAEMVKHLREDNIRRHSKMSCVEERDELEDPKDPRQAITCTTAPPLAEGPQFDSEAINTCQQVLKISENDPKIKKDVLDKARQMLRS